MTDIASITDRLNEILEKEFELASQGRISDAEPLLAERAVLIEQLQEASSQQGELGAEARASIEQLQSGVRRNLALLTSLRDEMKNALSESRATQRAVTEYSKSV